MTEPKQTVEEVETVEGEVVTDEMVLDGEPGSERKMRVYDRTRGDFVVNVPGDCRVTFGYFNPASAGGTRGGGYPSPAESTMRTTCLRIYEGKGDKNQIAAFLGVDGFRDHRIRLTRLTQKITVETNFEDDGEGQVKWGGQKQATPVLQLETSDDDIQF